MAQERGRGMLEREVVSTYPDSNEDRWRNDDPRWDLDSAVNHARANRPILYLVSGGLPVAQSILSPSVTKTFGRPRASSKTKAETQ